MPETTIYQTLETAFEAVDSHPHAQLVQAELKAIKGSIARIKVAENRAIKAKETEQASNPPQAPRKHNPGQ